MNAVALLFSIAAAAAGAPGISGHVLDANGAPVAGARVFLEQGLGAPLVETRSAQDGAYHFEGVRLGINGVFATARGYAFSGRSIDVAVAQTAFDVDIRLGQPGVVRGRVVSAVGKPIPNARITRAALLGSAKVGIPLAKLSAQGFEEPYTDSDGRFTVPALPIGMKVALKVTHPQFAQEGATDIAVGDREVEITLYRGVLVRGTVLSRGESLPVANAEVHIRNAAPPRDTTVTRTDTTGAFSARLKPGLYLYQASGAAFRSPGWQRLPVSGEVLTQEVTLYVGGLGAIKGKVMDARSGEALQGARIVLETLGAPAAIAHTGPGGDFLFTTSEGESIVRYDSAPGYAAPPNPAMKVHVTEGGVVDLPSFWVAPIPKYRLQVVDAQERPVPHAAVQVLRPPQFGWYTTDDEGRVELAFATLPSDGTVVGMVERLDEPAGALFAIKRDHSGDAVVQLLPLGRVEGQVLSEGGEALEGAVVDAHFADDSIPDRLVLWRALSAKDGSFSWNGVIPYVPQYCVVHTIDRKSGEGARGESPLFLVDSAAAKDIGVVTVDGGKKGKASRGDRLKWHDFPVLCGDADELKAFRGKPAVVIFCRPEEAGMVAEGLAVAQELFAGRGLSFHVVVDGDAACETNGIAILSGKAPGVATTYLVDGEGNVVLETFGMPPLHAVNALAPKR